MENKINERYIRLRGKALIEEELKLGEDVVVKVTVTDISDKDNNDGTVDRTYFSKALIPSNEEEMKLYSTKSPSKRLYDRMFVYYQDKHGTADGFDEWRVKALDTIGDKYLNQINKD